MPPDDSGPPGYRTKEPRHPNQPPPPLRVAGHLESKASGQQGPSKALVWVPCTWAHPQDLHSQLHRRRVAAARSVPLGCSCRDPYGCRHPQPLAPCGCRRDPYERHRCGGGLTAKQVDAYRDTVLHLRSLGLLAAPNLPAMRAMWARSPQDRRLVSGISQQWELAGGDG